ncbi:MAG: D-alanine--D-alanine ligase [Candidatus Moranbacteria bacterium]|nr:D-alanine--D-alanine ligase [Candidatus Moranbacteria bacterium]
MQKINLAVIFGGKSGEHEISLSSARGVISSLNKEKYNIQHLAITKKGQWLAGQEAEQYLELTEKFKINSEEVEKLISESKKDGLEILIKKEIDGEKIDVILPILHGPFGEDGKLQGMLEIINLPYIFSKPLAHAIAMNKPKAKIIAEHVGVLTANSFSFNKKDELDVNEIIDELDFPIVVKPAELGSSVGMTLAKNEKDLKAGIKKAFAVDENIILERFISGREMTVPVADIKKPEAVAVMEIIAQKVEWYDYNSKYEEGGSRHVCPAEIPEEVEQKLKEQAVRIFQEIGCRDLARADFIWDDENDQIYFLEINTIPGMTPTSLAPETIQKNGMELGDFLDKLIEKRLG